MAQQSKGIVPTLLGYLSGLRFPYLFGLVALLFGIDLVLPDVFPFIDELLLGSLTLLLGAWRKRKDTITRTVDANEPAPGLPEPAAEDAAGVGDEAE